MNVNNSLVITGREGSIRGTNGNGKNTIKISKN